MTTKQLARIYKALSNENRLEIYLSILQYEQKDFDTGCDCIITEIRNKLCIGAPTISHHLKELTDAGLITTKKQGKYLIAKVNQTVLHEIRHQFDQIT
ncbi:MAG: ArsR family transcriptional regulator [bacterium]|nr:ArsR family transcriptional regulator [bacterium]